MAGQLKTGDTVVGRLITKAWRALTAPGAGSNPAKGNGALRMSDIHPHGSCARNWRPPDFSDLFAPETFTDETPDTEKNRR